MPFVRKTREQLHAEFVQFRNESIAFILYALFIVVLFITCAIVQAMQPTELEVLHAEICEVQAKSPLCTSFETLEMVDRVAGEKGVPTRLVVGIANAESSIGINFNKGACSGYNNWFGLKGKMDDSGKVTMYATNRRKPDQNGCWLYKFNTLEEGIQSLTNTLSIGYAGCKNDIVCVSYDFVGDPNKSETSWVKNVETFYKKV